MFINIYLEHLITIHAVTSLRFKAKVRYVNYTDSFIDKLENKYTHRLKKGAFI